MPRTASRRQTLVAAGQASGSLAASVCFLAMVAADAVGAELTTATPCRERSHTELRLDQHLPACRSHSFYDMRGAGHDFRLTR